MVRDAFYFLIPTLVAALVLLAAGWKWSAMAALLVALFFAYFFRDPFREIPVDPGVIVSPADGRIVKLEPVGDSLALSIFLSPFDVHVNRAPISGTILSQEYRKGRFLAAYDHRASVENERLIITIGSKEGGRQLTFALIAGVLARRIVPWKKPGEAVRKGDKIALIRFGSRVDVFLPSGCEVLVKPGDQVKGGSSIIARWRLL
ncbi:MAG: phosphatidylserine decarboxylase [Acidobacteria bacterium]|nr:phosphatidylserine decarboxylase [Acidobacteriota bacterium]